ncbi:MAG TPA: hypothetical protein VK181_12290, partial [Rhizobium sp.]|nr:hypothetical protein [Rhizobium sp.]
SRARPVRRRIGITRVTRRETLTDMIVRPLSPPLKRRLAVVIRRDKRLDLGLRRTLTALKALESKNPQ